MKKEKTTHHLTDYDFNECMKYAPWGKEDIDEIIACIPGEADGYNWHYIVKLKKEGLYGYLTGGCDYTGWGCQEDGRGCISYKKHILDFVPEEEGGFEIRTILRKQIEGEHPYGCK